MIDCMGKRGAKRDWEIGDQALALVSNVTADRKNARRRAYADVLNETLSELLKAVDGTTTWNGIFEFHVPKNPDEDEPRGYYPAVALAAARIANPTSSVWQVEPPRQTRSYSLNDVIGTALSLALKDNYSRLPEKFLKTNRDGSQVTIFSNCKFFVVPVNDNFTTLKDRCPTIVNHLLAIPSPVTTDAAWEFDKVLSAYTQEAGTGIGRKPTAFPTTSLKIIVSGVSEDPEVRLTIHAMVDSYLLAHRKADEPPALRMLTKFPLGLPPTGSTSEVKSSSEAASQSLEWTKSFRASLDSFTEANARMRAEAKLAEYTLRIVETEHLAEQGASSKNETPRIKTWAKENEGEVEAGLLAAHATNLVHNARVSELLAAWHADESDPIDLVANEPAPVRHLFWEALHLWRKFMDSKGHSEESK